MNSEKASKITWNTKGLKNHWGILHSLNTTKKVTCWKKLLPRDCVNVFDAVFPSVASGVKQENLVSNMLIRLKFPL